MNIIKPPVRDPKGFLLQHIQRDLEQLMKMLGRSADETTSVVHLVLSHLLREHGHSEEPGMGPRGVGHGQQRKQRTRPDPRARGRGSGKTCTFQRVGEGRAFPLIPCWVCSEC